MSAITVVNWLTNAHDVLVRAGSESPKADSEYVLGFVLQRPRTWLYTWGDHVLSDDEQTRLDQLLKRRVSGEPIAHLTGEQGFWTLMLAVNASTLIPRPDTETLVEWVLDLDLTAAARCLDLGTGTGAIALAMASEKPGWQVSGVDVMPDAVALAKSNARKNQLESVLFYQSHWFDSVDGQFDLIVSNPPYIDSNDPHLSQGDVRFEPSSALVADQHGLSDLAHIIEHSQGYLTQGGWLLLEHGYQQSDAVSQALMQRGFSSVSTRYDLGGQPRITGGQWIMD